jgi:hypothetical protein
LHSDGEGELTPVEREIVEEMRHGKATNKQMAKEYHKNFTRLKELREIAEGKSAPEGKETADGEIAARCFGYFRSGWSPEKVVTETKLPPKVVKGIYRDWLDMTGGMYLSRDEKIAIYKAVYHAEPRDDQLAHFGGKSIVTRVNEVWEVCDSASTRASNLNDKLAAFNFPCCVCGETMFLTQPVWRELVKSGYLSGWGHLPCIKKK